MNAPPVQLHCLPSGYQARQAGVYQAKSRPALLFWSLLDFPILCSPSGYIPFQSKSFCTEPVLTHVCLRATVLSFLSVLQSGLACSLLLPDRLALYTASPLGYALSCARPAYFLLCPASPPLPYTSYLLTQLTNLW